MNSEDPVVNESVEDESVANRSVADESVAKESVADEFMIQYFINFRNVNSWSQNLIKIIRRRSATLWRGI